MSKFTYHRDSPQNSVSKPIYAPGPPNKTEARRSHPLGRRIVARLLDFILQGLLFVFVALVLNGTIFPARSFSDDSGLSLLALILTYFLLFELLIRTPPGKSLVGLEVTELDGSRPGNLSIVYRNVARLVDEVMFTPLLGIAFVIFQSDRRRIGDLIAKTVVRSKNATIDDDSNSEEFPVDSNIADVGVSQPRSNARRWLLATILFLVSGTTVIELSSIVFET